MRVWVNCILSSGLVDDTRTWSHTQLRGRFVGLLEGNETMKRIKGTENHTDNKNRGTIVIKPTRVNVRLLVFGRGRLKRDLPGCLGYSCLPPSSSTEFSWQT